jgi:hypothetical protein
MKWTVCLLLCIFSASSMAQGIMADVLAGKLVEPEVGVFAWYELNDAATKKKLFLRQAIVGEKKIKRKTGYWLETQIIPQVGFPVIYKMLLTGPANDAKYVHEVLVKEGQQPVRSITVNPADDLKTSSKASRKSLGRETFKLIQDEITAEHFVVKEGDEELHVWLNDEVRPMGIVRMISPQGELMLSRFGLGGSDALPAIPEDWESQQQAEPEEPKVKVIVEHGVPGYTEDTPDDKKQNK